MPAKPLSKDQLDDAARLKQRFRQWQAVRAEAGESWSQDYCSEQLQMGQSAINQYLNGKIPLNLAALVKFTNLIGASMHEISPNLAAALTNLTGRHVVSTTAPQRDRWLFPAIDRNKLEDLDAASLTRLEGAILMAAKQLELDIRKK